MSELLLIWLFPVAISFHNLEEAVWLPQWSENAGRWQKRVEAGSFRFAVVVLTLLAYLVSALTVWGGKQSLGAYLLAGYALAMLLNVVMPHLAACVALKKYAPGTGTAIAFNLPVTFLLLRQMILQNYIELSRFYWAGPLTVVVILTLIPLLFAVGRKLTADS
ncbi:MAG: HXXEE domain-containing protein [Proteobacteria bacterium]|nr:HXXEE domain-containing protein [Pseudomonadota bacterium]